MPYRNEDDARRARREANTTPAHEHATWRPTAATWTSLGASALACAVFATTFVGADAARSPRQPVVPTSRPDTLPTRAEATRTNLGPSIMSGRGVPSAALGGRDIESGTRLAHIAADTLFHLDAGAECEVETHTQAGACAVSVRCGGRTLYSADEAHGLTCIRGLVGASAVFDRGTTSMDGTPALVVTREEVTLVDNTTSQRGILRLTYSPLAVQL